MFINRNNKRKSQQSIFLSNNKNNIGKYSTILKNELSMSKGTNISETKETVIENNNANNDITFSIDLNIDKAYDYKNLDQHCDFVDASTEDDPFCPDYPIPIRICCLTTLSKSRNHQELSDKPLLCDLKSDEGCFSTD